METLPRLALVVPHPHFPLAVRVTKPFDHRVAVGDVRHLLDRVTMPPGEDA